jgi:hypothetical protein
MLAGGQPPDGLRADASGERRVDSVVPAVDEKSGLDPPGREGGQQRDACDLPVISTTRSGRPSRRPGRPRRGDVGAAAERVGWWRAKADTSGAHWLRVADR